MCSRSIHFREGSAGRSTSCLLVAAGPSLGPLAGGTLAGDGQHLRGERENGPREVLGVGTTAHLGDYLGQHTSSIPQRTRKPRCKAGLVFPGRSRRRGQLAVPFDLGLPRGMIHMWLRDADEMVPTDPS
jgi:hypothetical protein